MIFIFEEKVAIFNGFYSPNYFFSFSDLFSKLFISGEPIEVNIYNIAYQQVDNIQSVYCVISQMYCVRL